MSSNHAYHRPTTLEDALRLLAEPGAVVLAGGTTLVARLADAYRAAVDLQALGLDKIAVGEQRMTVGATATLRALVDHPATPALIRQCARREGPNTFRNAGTIGGVAAVASRESELYAALLVHEADVAVATRSGHEQRPLDGLVLPPGAIITAVSFSLDGKTAVERVARTPADAPIVAAVVRRTPDGRTLLALTGVGVRPLLISPADLAELEPPADFRGSSVYRKEMGRVLSERVLRTLDLALSESEESNN